MLNQKLRFSKMAVIDSLIKIAIGLALLCFLSPIEIKEGINVPITLQSMLIILVPLLFGFINGGMAVLFYLLLGGLGAPVFANGASGWDVFTGVSGGFLFGFVFAAFVVGFFAEKKWRMTSLAAAALMIGGQLIILIFGLYWMERVLDEPLDWMIQLKKFIPGLMIKAAFGMIIYILVERLVHSAMKTKALGNP